MSPERLNGAGLSLTTFPDQEHLIAIRMISRILSSWTVARVGVMIA